MQPAATFVLPPPQPAPRLEPRAPLSTPAFEKARTGLWASLQKHLAAVYEAEARFLQAVAFADALPFAAAAASAEQLEDYARCRAALRDLHTDETAQLEVLTKAIRTKGYSEDEKKQLYLLIAGYLDIAGTAFDLLRTHVPTPLPKEEEQEETAARFDRVRKFARLNVKGIKGLLGGA